MNPRTFRTAFQFFDVIANRSNPLGLLGLRLEAAEGFLPAIRLKGEIDRLGIRGSLLPVGSSEGKEDAAALEGDADAVIWLGRIFCHFPAICEVPGCI